MQHLVLITFNQVTVDKSFPLSYEMAMKPEEIATLKSFNSYNTGQLEGTLGHKTDGKEMGGQLLSECMAND